MQVADRTDPRRPVKLRTKFRPQLGPPIIGGAEKEEGIGPHLPVLVGEIGFYDRNSAPKPVLETDDVHAETYDLHFSHKEKMLLTRKGRPIRVPK